MASPSLDGALAYSDDDAQLQCRACSEQGADYELVALFGGVGLLGRIFTVCTGVVCSAGDGLPAHLCAGCNAKLVAFNKFRQRCAQWDERFRAMLPPQPTAVQLKREPEPENDAIESEEGVNDKLELTLEDRTPDQTVTNDEKPKIDESDDDEEVELVEQPDDDGDGHEDDTSHVYELELQPDDGTFSIFPDDETATIVDDNDDDNDDPSHAHNDSSELYEDTIIPEDSIATEFLDISTHTPSPTNTNLTSAAVSRIRHPNTDTLTTIVYQCDICDASFSKKHRLEKHLLEQHIQSDSGRRHVCGLDDCTRAYVSRPALDAHQRKWHDSVGDESKPSLVAPRLLNRAKIEPAADADVYTIPASTTAIHDPVSGHAVAASDASASAKPHRRFVCDQCGKMFSSKGALKKHDYVHSDAELPFACLLCPKRYVTKHKLKEHTMRHEGVKNHICPYCGIRKTTPHELKVHINYHTREKMWPCDQCAMSFTSIGNMTRHVRIVHDGVRAFPCTFCQRSFGKAETLKHHVMTHTGERPHGCELCGKRFIQLVALQAHVRMHRKQSVTDEMHVDEERVKDEAEAEEVTNEIMVEEQKLAK